MIEKFKIEIMPSKQIRTIHVYLPDDYYNQQQRYPVMYMYDGHNLFNDEDATYGKSWGLKEFMDQYDKKVIIVGIDCNHEGNERLNEYCPYQIANKYWGKINGYGKEFMDWLIATLKPLIDNKYRTYPFRECTGIAGSSMGGLMALYTVMMYNNYFSKAACISPAISFCPDQLEKDFNQLTISGDTRVYFSFGTREVDSVEKRVQMINRFIELLAKQNAFSYLNVIENGEHNEASWEKENQTYFDFLWK